MAAGGTSGRPPYGFQHLINRARWDEDDVRRIYEALSDDNGGLVMDETGFLKKDHHSVGGKRQYSGTLGRVENGQIGVFLGYASCEGQGLIDRALFLPRDWADDPERCRQAGIPENMNHMPTTALAQEMLSWTLDSGVTARWVTGDAVYGESFQLR